MSPASAVAPAGLASRGHRLPTRVCVHMSSNVRPRSPSTRLRRHDVDAVAIDHLHLHSAQTFPDVAKSPRTRNSGRRGAINIITSCQSDSMVQGAGSRALAWSTFCPSWSDAAARLFDQRRREIIMPYGCPMLASHTPPHIRSSDGNRTSPTVESGAMFAPSNRNLQKRTSCEPAACLLE